MSKSRRGFASMKKADVLRIASMGGKSVAPEDRAFSRDARLAMEAGSKGGQNVPAEKRSYSTDRTLAREAGRKGGLARGRNLRVAAQ